MKKLLLIIITMFSVLFILSCGKNVSNNITVLNKDGFTIYDGNFYLLKGNIGTSPVTMYLDMLSNLDNGVRVKYYYDNNGKFIYLYGSYTNNKIEVIKYSRDGVDIDESITGEISKNGIFKGKWTSKNTNYNLDFKLYSSSIISSANLVTVTMYTNIKIEEEYYSFDFQKTAILADNKNTNFNNVIDKINGSTSMKDNLVSIMTNEAYQSYSNWNALMKGDSNQVIGFNYQAYLNDEITYADNNIASFIRLEYTYSGGAHGSTLMTPLIYDLNTSATINTSASNLIVNIQDNKLRDLLNKKLLEDRTKENYFDFNTIELNNFYITPYGIIFIWNQYDIAPYSEGIIEVSFSFEELKPFVKEDSVFYYLFK